MTTKTNSRRTSARPLQKRGTPGENGSLTNTEKQKLVLQALDAWKIADPDTSFDVWRSEQVMECVGLPGISKLNRSHWRTVSAHFLTIAGKESEAFALLNKTGIKSYQNKDQRNNWETAESYVFKIQEALAAHAQDVAEITPAWFLAAARQRTGKPSLTMDTLAERLDPKTLHGLLSHLRNHISRREGREDPSRRSARKYPKPDDSSDNPF